MKRIIHLFLLIFILVPSKNLNSQDDKKSKPNSKDKAKSFASIVSEATKDEGLFNVYKKDNKYYFEIPDSLVGREMLMVTRVAKMSVSIPLTQHKLNEQVLRWEKKGENFLFRYLT